MSNHSFSKASGMAHYSPANGFLQSCISYPDRKALVVDNISYSYKELLSHVYPIYLQLCGEKKHERIAVWCDGGLFPYAAILAVSLYGACYVPLNAKFPAERNHAYFNQSRAGLLLSNKTISIKEPDPSRTLVFNQNTTAVSFDQPLIPQVDQQLAYILFTSGSTGDPKGVPVSKKNLQAFFGYFAETYDFNSSDGFLQPYEFTFDVSVFSMFMPWQYGACCYDVPKTGIRYLDIVSTMQKYPVTVASMVPGVLKFIEKYIGELSFPALRYSFFSGDSLLHSLAVKWKKAIPNGAIHNFYGPTETTIVCTRYVWDEKKSGEEAVHDTVPLGIPFKGMDICIVDENNVPVPEGEKGELCFSGSQVIEHYLSSANTAAFFDLAGKNWYKTGDIASVNKKGNLVFYGRNDSQVKINGYRVELAEIEQKIKQLGGDDCAVLCLKDKSGMNYTVAVVAGTGINLGELRNDLGKSLPEYMVPKRFILIENLPVNLNGKTDRKQLLNWLNEHQHTT